MWLVTFEQNHGRGTDLVEGRRSVTSLDQWPDRYERKFLPGGGAQASSVFLTRSHGDLRRSREQRRSLGEAVDMANEETRIDDTVWTGRHNGPKPCVSWPLSPNLPAMAPALWKTLH